MSAEEFTKFAGSLSAITTAIGDGVEADGEPRSPDMEMPVLWMSSVGHAISAALPSLPQDSQRAVFAAVEDGMASGTELLRTAIATGLLEAIGHDVDRARVPRELVTPLLGPRSRAYLEEWDAFTLGEPTAGTS
jgi:hypothetical protein